MRIAGHDHLPADPAKVERQEAAARGKSGDDSVRLIIGIAVAVAATDCGHQPRQRKIARFKGRPRHPIAREGGKAALKLGRRLVAVESGMKRGEKRAEPLGVTPRGRRKGGQGKRQGQRSASGDLATGS